jgi:hypothetical protein
MGVTDRHGNLFLTMNLLQRLNSLSIGEAEAEDVVFICLNRSTHQRLDPGEWTCDYEYLEVYCTVDSLETLDDY